MGKKRIVVTGLGIICPLGNNVEIVWNNIISGNSGVDIIKEYNISQYKTKIAGIVKNFNILKYITKKEIKKCDIFVQYGIAAATQAIEDAQINNITNNDLLKKIGVIIGSGIGGITSVCNNNEKLNKYGPKKVSPFFITSSITNMISGNISIKYGFKGPNLALATACTTSSHSIILGVQLIQMGNANIMVVGGSEKSSNRLGLAGFSSMKALSKNINPKEASKPWDINRDGFILGDGAGVIILEEYNHAIKRHAKIYAEIIGYGMSADAYHITKPSLDGSGAFNSMNLACKNAQINPETIDHINAHATSTAIGDILESIAIKRLIKNNNTTVTSNKSMIGHLLGAAGCVESILTILSINHQIVPPTINSTNIDKNCKLKIILKYAKQQNIKIALKNSFGFGGTNASILFKKI